MANELIKYEGDQLELIKRTVARGLTDDEFQLAIAISERTGLDLLSRQLYAIKRKDHKTGKETMTMQTGIDGYRSIADRQSDYAGSDDPTYDEGLTQYEMIRAGRAVPTTATVTVYKLVGGIRCPFTATATWASYYPGDSQGFMWRKFPFLMLAKCAEALALRKGWAAHMHGVYVQEEMEQAYQSEAEEATTPPRVYQRKASQAELKAGAAATETKRRTIAHNAVEPPVEPEADEGEFEDVPPLGANPINPTGDDDELEPAIEGFADKRDELVYYCGEIERACGFKDGDVLFALSSFEGRDGKTIWMRDPYKPGLKESWIDMTLHKAHQVFDALKDAIDPVAAYHQALRAMKK
ncbi:MAG: phage recombination protein Bet [bacterium]|jgi:phage recombination protein Bet